jgi:hypothetical protein
LLDDTSASYRVKTSSLARRPHHHVSTAMLSFTHPIRTHDLDVVINRMSLRTARRDESAATIQSSATHLESTVSISQTAACIQLKLLNRRVQALIIIIFCLLLSTVILLSESGLRHPSRSIVEDLSVTSNRTPNLRRFRRAQHPAEIDDQSLSQDGATYPRARYTNAVIPIVSVHITTPFYRQSFLVFCGKQSL